MMINPEHAQAARAPQRATPRIEYVRLATGAESAPLPRDVLAAITFGRGGSGRRARSDASAASATGAPDPRLIGVALEPLAPPGLVELWRVAGPVHTGREGAVRFAADEEHLAGLIELDEREYGGLAATTEWAYASIRRFHARSSHPHVLRMWNYFNAINRGEGDDERYKQFCCGRAAGFLGRAAAAAAAGTGLGAFPAATAIGRRDGSPTLQVYWLAARTPGTPLENPRQVSAFRYPRQYGPAPPSFSRAMLVSGRLLMISGTASVIGHASCHPGSLEQQLEETLVNLGALLERAAAMQPALARRWGAQTLLKVYLRDGAETRRAAALLAERLPPAVECLLLEADICRAELLVEIDAVHA